MAKVLAERYREASMNRSKRRNVMKKLLKAKQLYLMLVLPVAYFVLFGYIPMYGIQIAFKKYIAVKGIWGSPWVGLKNFQKFFNSYQFWRVLTNTLGLSVYQWKRYGR